jgi:hypothetical protein
MIAGKPVWPLVRLAEAVKQIEAALSLVEAFGPYDPCLGNTTRRKRCRGLGDWC